MNVVIAGGGVVGGDLAKRLLAAGHQAAVIEQSPETVERLTRAVAQGGFDAETSRRAATALLHFVLGHVSHEQQRLQYDSLGVLADAETSPLDEDDPAAAFAFGVGLLVGGLELSRSRR